MMHQRLPSSSPFVSLPVLRGRFARPGVVFVAVLVALIEFFAHLGGCAAQVPSAGVGTVKAAQKISALAGGGPALGNGDSFGSSIASLGDLDGDSVPDICVGAYKDDDGLPGRNRGAVYILFLNSNGTVKASQKISATQGGLTESGVSLAEGDRFGISIAALGDFDGDSVPDICVGAYNNDGGALYVLLLHENGTIKSSKNISPMEGGGPALDNGDEFGYAISPLDDFDGDSVPDICVGAPADDDCDGGSDADCGAVYMLFLNSDGTVNSSQKISSDAGGLTESGVTLGDKAYFGSSVSATGDFDGDAVPDICVGAYNDPYGSIRPGAVYMLFLNIDGTVKASQKISASSGELTESGVVLGDRDYFGQPVASAGDFDGDSVIDIFVGADGDDDGGLDRGALYLLFLKRDGTVKSSQKISSTAGGLNASGVELADSDYFGNSVAFLGDFDGDSAPNIFVGAYYDESGGLCTDCGAVYLLLLNGTTLTPVTTAAENLTLTPTSSAATSIISTSATATTSTISASATASSPAAPAPTASERASSGDEVPLLILIIAIAVGVFVLVMILVLFALFFRHRRQEADSDQSLPGTELETHASKEGAKYGQPAGTALAEETTNSATGDSNHYLTDGLASDNYQNVPFADDAGSPIYHTVPGDEGSPVYHTVPGDEGSPVYHTLPLAEHQNYQNVPT